MSDTFIHEIPLKTTPHDEAVLDVRLDAARNLYNACLRESLRRLDLMRESKAYRAARVLPKGKARNAVFKTARGFHGFPSLPSLFSPHRRLGQFEEGPQGNL